MGALLCFDMNNVRYLTATHIGTWARTRQTGLPLLPQNDGADPGGTSDLQQSITSCIARGLGSDRSWISMLRGA